MTNYFDNYDNTAQEIIRQLDKNIIIGIPVGLGKPIGFLNALYRMAEADSSIHLTIVTGLTLARPFLRNELEKRLVEPILDRLLKDCEDPLYERARELQKLPANINVIEFFLTPGKFVHNAYVQQNYISSNYTDAVRDGINLSINVLAQQVAPSSTHSNFYSLSCNTDLFHDMRAHLKKLEDQGKKIAIVAEVNENLPFMLGKSAEVDSSFFSTVIDTKNYRSLFAIPREKLLAQDYLIGLYTSCLIKDDGCLQIGIGKLSNALSAGLIFRHKENKAYQDVLTKLKVQDKFWPVISEWGETGVFNKGLYASTEMFSDEYMQLYFEGILKKKVYDHTGLQKLLNAGMLSEVITPDWIDALIESKIIKVKLRNSDIHFLKEFGIFKSTVGFKDNNLILASGESFSADLNIPDSKQRVTRECLGEKLKSGKVMHAGFSFGSVDLYTQLHNLRAEQLQEIEMCSIAQTNTLSSSPTLLKLQRQKARFVNSSIMLGLLGNVISDGLSNGKEISGVGGQHDFAIMASELEGARFIINCRSTREMGHNTESNIVWDYEGSTLPRYLRDIFVTEYGIADCRSKTDAEIIKSILNITDSRFQDALLKKAKKSGKLAQDYQIPDVYQNNYPEIFEKIIEDAQSKGYCKAYPYGSDLTQEEEVLAEALLSLSKCSLPKLGVLILGSFFRFQASTNFDSYLQRMKLKHPRNIKDYFYKKLLISVLRRSPMPGSI